MEPTQFEQLLFSRLDRLEDKVDKVRSEDLPNLKAEVAVLINENKSTSKLHAFIGSIVAVIVGAAMPHR